MYAVRQATSGRVEALIPGELVPPECRGLTDAALGLLSVSTSHALPSGLVRRCYDAVVVDDKMSGRVQIVQDMEELSIQNYPRSLSRQPRLQVVR